MKWWRRFFPIYVAACAWPLVVDAMFRDLPRLSPSEWAVWTTGVLAVAAFFTGALSWADRRQRNGGRTPRTYAHVAFSAVLLVGVAPAFTEAIADRAWPFGSPTRLAIALGGLVVIAAVATLVQALVEPRPRDEVSPRS
jgi:hypothetical protein